MATQPIPEPDSGWRRARIAPSLAEVYRSVPVSGGWWRKVLAFAGPGYLVAVGYMDPGNWATDLAGGSKFGYSLRSEERRVGKECRSAWWAYHLYVTVVG